MSESKNSEISVAIDGPAGAGKSTTARMLAKKLQIVYVDSGAMYRAVAWSCGKAGLSNDDTDAIIALANSLEISFLPPETGQDQQRILVNGVDITGEIRTQAISQAASTVSVISEVRESLVAKQRALGQAGGVVMEGRDIGTVVLPDADVKIFLTASIEERARRRYQEFVQKGMTDQTLDRVREDMAERDKRDTTRAVSPLRPAADSVILDSDDMDADQVVAAIMSICDSKVAAKQRA